MIMQYQKTFNIIDNTSNQPTKLGQRIELK